MAFSDQNELMRDTESCERTEYDVLKAHAADCRLSDLDKRALAEYLKHADHVATGVYFALSRLLRRKLDYATDMIEANPTDSVATGGSRITFAIDKLRPQKGRLLNREFYQPGQDDISMASLLGATLTGMKTGDIAPFLQADGSFRQVRLISVEYQAGQPRSE